jgi:glutathione S-transferase
MIATPHAYFDPIQAAAFNELAPKKDSTFEVHYFGLHGMGGIPRDILAISGSKFTSVIPTDWSSEKPSTPFGVIPLLKETSADGKIINRVCETDAIERYLAKKFGLLGDNAFEETVINSFVNNSNGYWNTLAIKYFRANDPESKAKNKEEISKTVVQSWVQYLEQHLAANGSNGHVVGDKLTFADIKIAKMIEITLALFPGSLSKETHPAILKVKETMDEVPNLKAWRATDDYKAISEKNMAVLGFP